MGTFIFFYCLSFNKWWWIVLGMWQTMRKWKIKNMKNRLNSISEVLRRLNVERKCYKQKKNLCDLVPDDLYPNFLHNNLIYIDTHDCIYQVFLLRNVSNNSSCLQISNYQITNHKWNKSIQNWIAENFLSENSLNSHISWHFCFFPLFSNRKLFFF